MDLLEYIKKSKKYSAISSEVIKKEIKKYFKINPKSKKYLDNVKSKKFKEIVKGVKARLHLIYGSFQKDRSKREEYLKQIYGINDYKHHDKILSTSVSSKERLKDYEKLYKKIFLIAGKPNKIIDLGCGLNPVSFPYMGVNKLSYYAYDINKEDCDFLNKYFKSMKQFSKLNGKAFVVDLRDIKKLPRADVCFMFKFLDVIEEKGHKLSEEIIKKINCKYIVVSFPTKTVSGRKMKHAYRGWIERMLNRIKLKFEKILLDNEVFYIIYT